MEYKLITVVGNLEFEKAVNREIQYGWTPQGGVVVISELQKEVQGKSVLVREFAQAMVKNDTERSQSHR